MGGTPVDRSETFTGAGSRSVQLRGRYVRVLEADASGVTITTHPGSPLLRFVGQDIDAGVGGFQSLDLTVTVASTVKICVSDDRQTDTNTNVTATVNATIAPAGTINQPGDVNCPNGVATQLVAGNANGLTVIVRASSALSYAEGTVRVGTTAVGAASGIELNPGETQIWATTAPLFAYNGTGAAINLQVEPLAK